MIARRDRKGTSEAGWAVAIRREDGTEFLASSGLGMMPAVFSWRGRKYAVAHKKDLKLHGFKARVVMVRYGAIRIATKGRS